MKGTLCGIMYDSFSLKSLKMNQTDLAAFPSNTGEILCKWLAVKINPSDLNQTEGTYPSRPSLLPAYGGNEGVAEVVQLSQFQLANSK